MLATPFFELVLVEPTPRMIVVKPKQNASSLPFGLNGLGALEELEPLWLGRHALQPATIHREDTAVRKLDRKVLVVGVHADLIALALEGETDLVHVLTLL